MPQTLSRIGKAVPALFASAWCANPASDSLPNPYESGFQVWGGRQFLTRPVVQVMAGDGQTAAIQDDGRVVVWGLYGWTAMPAHLPALRKIRLTDGSSGNAGIRISDSTPYYWGHSSQFLPNSATKILDFGFDAHNTYTVGFDGSVTYWDYKGGNVVAGLADVRSIEVGIHHGLAIRDDGAVLALPGSDSANLPPIDLGSAQAIAIGNSHSAALLKDGSIRVWGDKTGKRLGVPPGLQPARAIASKSDAMAAWLTDSTVVAWGTNSYLKTDSVAQLGKARSFAVGGSHFALSRPDGTVEVFAGPDRSEQAAIPAGFHGLKEFAANQMGSLALLRDGTVRAYGDINDWTPPSWLDHVAKISMGPSIALAIQEDGTLIPWPQQSSLYSPLAGLPNVADAKAGRLHALVLFRDGTIAAFGRLGSSPASAPSGLGRVKAIASGMDFAVALTENDSVVAWGDTCCGLLRVPPHHRAVAIASGLYHTLLLQDDGRVVAWGDSTNHAERVPPGLDSVVAIAAGGFHSIALRANGEVVTWGDNSSYQCVPPANLGRSYAVFGGYDCTIAVQDSGATTSLVPRGSRTGSRNSASIEILSLDGRRLWSGVPRLVHGQWMDGWTGRGTAIRILRSPQGTQTTKIVRP